MCETIRDIIIGLISGAISSLIISVILKKYWDNQEHKKRFLADKQVYSRYIQTIRVELLLASKTEDYDFLVRAIDDEPIRESFNMLSDQSKASIDEISTFLNELKNEALSQRIPPERYKVLNSKLFQYSVWVLKLTERNNNGTTHS